MSCEKVVVLLAPGAIAGYRQILESLHIEEKIIHLQQRKKKLSEELITALQMQGGIFLPSNLKQIKNEQSNLSLLVV
jgi:hypothetical protein